jgi:uracil phosphoribosyltransferase
MDTLSTRRAIETYSFADLGRDAVTAPRGAEIWRLLREFSRPDIRPGEAQGLIRSMTNILLVHRFGDLRAEDVLLIPVLRAGIAMWMEANAFFGGPETCFVQCTKEKGTRNVRVLWPSVPALGAKAVLVLDTVIATGDTINAVCRILREAQGGGAAELHVVSCYASPEGIQAISDARLGVQLTVGAISETVDAAGYLVPRINGDAGDKLFGKKTD